MGDVFQPFIYGQKVSMAVATNYKTTWWYTLKMEKWIMEVI